MSNLSDYLLSKIEHVLLRQGWISEGRMDAFTFAVQCHADVSSIETEIKERDALMAELLADFPKNGPMSPGASPRIYREAYLAGLREALALIQGMSANN
jgi:hypothetical protein